MFLNIIIRVLFLFFILAFVITVIGFKYRAEKIVSISICFIAIILAACFVALSYQEDALLEYIACIAVKDKRTIEEEKELFKFKAKQQRYRNNTSTEVIHENK